MDGYKNEMDLLDIAPSVYGAALAAVDAARLVETNVLRDGEELRILGEIFELSSFENVRLMAFGKAAAGMAEALADILGARLTGGLVVTPAPETGRRGASRRPRKGKIIPGPAGEFRSHPQLEYLEAPHPLPDERSVEAARRALDMAGRAGGQDLIFICISGGGSSLLCLPVDGITLEEKKAVTQDLLKAGADIRELNAVRKHLSGIKGGRLAKAASPATVINLIISDVNGDDPETIASGPAHWDSSTFADARDVLKKYRLWDDRPPSVRKFIEAGVRADEPETLKNGDPVFEHVRTFVIGNNLTALRAARREAEHLGFEPFILTSTDEGEARQAAKDYVAFIASLACSMSTAPKPVCLLAGGELTVSVRGKGRGGRNMEFVLAALVEMQNVGLGGALPGSYASPEDGAGLAGNRPFEWLILSLGTDGIDGPTDAAGAWVDRSTLDRARELGVDPQKSLDGNDSYSFFNRTGNLIVTGPTGTNVCDLRVFLLRPE
jgi:glycerate-2-kinase